MDDVEAAVRQAFAQQAGWCGRLGSPFTERLCDLLGRKLDRTTATGRRVLEWPGQPGGNGDIVPLRLVGGLHALVRRGRLPRLATHYPPNPLSEPDSLWAALEDALRDADAELSTWLDSAPQTNEVGRSAVLMSGLLVIASQYPMPIALYELGASAGLNMVLDRYRYRLGDTEAGAPGAALALRPKWDGPSPPAARVSIIHRRGVDLQPLDVTREQDRERLAAYVWPDQERRVAQLTAAIAIAATDPPPIDRGDAGRWFVDTVDVGAEQGLVRVLTHTIAYQYFPADTQAAIVAHATKVGAAATSSAPFAWLRYEIDPTAGNVPTLRLTLWPDGEEHILAMGYPHGELIRWMAEEEVLSVSRSPPG